MDVNEGVIRFEYELRSAPAPGTERAGFIRLNAWRSILHRLSLLGQHSARYGGYGYGNVSMRTDTDSSAFLITASQTSGKPVASTTDWTWVRHADLRTFHVDATGCLPPSSEAMTHAMIYSADPAIRCVLHVHCPEIWLRTSALDLPATPEEIAYGTPALADAVAELMRIHTVRPLVFTTLGHEDGVFACGKDIDTAAHALLDQLARAMESP